jgi:hypothetical protein
MRVDLEIVPLSSVQTPARKLTPLHPEVAVQDCRQAALVLALMAAKSGEAPTVLQLSWYPSVVQSWSFSLRLRVPQFIAVSLKVVTPEQEQEASGEGDAELIWLEEAVLLEAIIELDRVDDENRLDGELERACDEEIIEELNSMLEVTNPEDEMTREDEAAIEDDTGAGDEEPGTDDELDPILLNKFDGEALADEDPGKLELA